jgi:hypothetical protein
MSALVCERACMGTSTFYNMKIRFSVVDQEIINPVSIYCCNSRTLEYKLQYMVQQSRHQDNINLLQYRLHYMLLSHRSLHRIQVFRYIDGLIQSKRLNT